MGKKVLGALCVIFCVFSFYFSSCQVGLGSAVDTAVPEISIEYPASNRVIRDWFVLSGTCKDDIGIESVKVQVTNASQKTSGDLVKATLSEDKTAWSIKINEPLSDGTYPYSDGSYEITVLAYDKAGHSTADKLYVVLDNSAPVLILSSPLKTVSDEAATGYGRTFKVAGDISDDNTVSSFKIQLRDYTGGTLAENEGVTIDIEDFGQMSADTPLVVAKYCTLAELAELETAGDTEALEAARESRANYLKIFYGDSSKTYSSDDIGTDEYAEKTYLATITLTDEARVYQDGVTLEGTGTGNSTENYYLNTTAFYKSLMSSSSYSLTMS